ncbi:hypothetical protein Bca52824_038672 [Brassica carinata]|uniref:Uncharacterized protein n=1 Tax=Brassica carinata TaxID=52824 RepID=A0A8X7RQ31_BRACI|nr:hypothetical protein Bca52824_038672 [Brassica carinata]
MVESFTRDARRRASLKTRGQKKVTGDAETVSFIGDVAAESFTGDASAENLSIFLIPHANPQSFFTGSEKILSGKSNGGG